MFPSAHRHVFYVAGGGEDPPNENGEADVDAVASKLQEQTITEGAAANGTGRYPIVEVYDLDIMV